MKTSEWLEKLKINGKLLTVQLDAGAKSSVMSVKPYNTPDVKSPIQPTNTKLKACTGHVIDKKE